MRLGNYVLQLKNAEYVRNFSKYIVQKTSDPFNIKMEYWEYDSKIFLKQFCQFYVWEHYFRHDIQKINK